MIPQLYFQYLRTGVPGRCGRVFYHNLQDILSLAILTVACATDVVEHPGTGMVRAPGRLLKSSLGRVYSGLGRTEDAIRCFERALKLGLPAQVGGRGLVRLALIEKRRQNWRGRRFLVFGRALDLAWISAHRLRRAG